MLGISLLSIIHRHKEYRRSEQLIPNYMYLFHEFHCLSCARSGQSFNNFVSQNVWRVSSAKTVPRSVTVQRVRPRVPGIAVSVSAPPAGRAPHVRHVSTMG